MTGQSGKTAGATKPAPTGVPSLGTSGPTISPPSMGPVVIGATSSLAAPSVPPPPGTPGRGTTGNSDKSHSKGQNGSKVGENSDTAMAAKAHDSGKNDPKNPSENGKPVKKPGNDKAGKGPDKKHHDDLSTRYPKLSNSTED